MIFLIQIFSPGTIAISSLCAGIAGLYLTVQRRFNRRVFYRTYAYRNFFLSLLLPLLDCLGSLVSIALILLGLFLILFA